MTSTGENAGGNVSGGEGGSGDGNGGRKGRKEGAVAVSAQAIQLSCSACLGGYTSLGRRAFGPVPCLL